MTKAELRQIYTEKRRALSIEEYAFLNRQLLAQFKTIDLSGVNCIHIFLPIISRREPDTRQLIEWIKQMHSHIKIAFPKTNFTDNSMQSFADDDNLQLAENSYGILEPVNGNIVSDHEIDMILLPLLAFDKRGYRVGYGKGFYDRFIEKCRDNVQLTGLSLFDSLDEISDVDSFDKRMQKCITPGKIYKF